MTFNDCIEVSLKNKQVGSVVDFKVNVCGQEWTAYEVSIVHRELFFYCIEGVVTYLVDSHGDKHTAELFDWFSDVE